jgi:hypothetical protein
LTGDDDDDELLAGAGKPSRCLIDAARGMAGARPPISVGPILAVLRKRRQCS